MAERTYLRIRRRRNAMSVATIRLEGLSKSVPDAPETKRQRTAIWRRVSSENKSEILEDDGNVRKRQYRVLDAVLEDEDLAQEKQPRARKRARRRLTLIDGESMMHNSFSSHQNPPKKVYKVLNPVERLVDDSLKQVFSGEKRSADHFKLCTTDERLEIHSRKWLVWHNDELGNLLHACALWNDVCMANELLSRELVGLTEGLDGEERTPYQVAELAGHTEICDMLQTTVDDYVFDLYSLDEADTDAWNGANTEEGDESMDALACELQGGVGYWDDNGHLVLDQRTHAWSEISVDDDVDSNHEDWDGNDYPDEEARSFEDGEDSEDERLLVGLRGRLSAVSYELEDNEGDFDPAYGIYGQGDPEYDLEG